MLHCVVFLPDSLGNLFMVVGSGRQEGGCVLNWIFIHGTNIADRGLIVLFFGLFSVAPPPPRNFSPDALELIL